ncbi:MAG: MFS transporter [Clostridiales bacterium]|jgi:fucose permease|nr:MFS transporter [Clostridiales bacterium]
MMSVFRRLKTQQQHLLYACFFAFFCNGALSMTLGSALPDLRAAYHLDEAVSGLMLSAHSGGNLAAGLLSGLAPLYLGEKRSILLLSALGFLGFLMMLVWGNPVWLIMAFLLTGMGRGSVTNFSNRKVNALTLGSPAASNMLHASFAVGALVTPLAFLALRRALSWQAGVGFVMVALLFSLFFMGTRPMEEKERKQDKRQDKSLVFLKNKAFLILGGMMFFYLCSEYSINGWLVTYIQSKTSLVESLGSGEGLQQRLSDYSQMMATLFWVLMLVGRLGSAALSAKIHQKTLMMLASFSTVVFFALMLFGSSIAQVTFAVAGLGLSMAGIAPMTYSDAAIFTNRYPLATGVLLAFGSAGAVLMPSLVGIMTKSLGMLGGMSLILGAIVLLAVFAVLNRLMLGKTAIPEEAVA